MILTAQAVAQDVNQYPKLVIAPYSLDGVWSACPADEYVPPAVMGIQKTVNIPSAAFNNDRDTASSTWFNGWGSYLRGQRATPTYPQAPVVFPKGAKKIVKFEYLYAAAAAVGTIALGECHYHVTNVTALGADAIPVAGSWTVSSYTRPTASQLVILLMNQYFIALKAVIITYK